jgi:hypothetical protein
MSAAQNLDEHSAKLADLSQAVAINSELLTYLEKPWDHGLNRTRLELTLRNLDASAAVLRGILDQGERRT